MATPTNSPTPTNTPEAYVPPQYMPPYFRPAGSQYWSGYRTEPAAPPSAPAEPSQTGTIASGSANVSATDVRTAVQDAIRSGTGIVLKAGGSDTVILSGDALAQIVNASRDVIIESGPVKVSIPADRLAGIAQDASSLKIIVRHEENTQPTTVPLNQPFTVEVLRNDIVIQKLDGLEVTVKLSAADAANPDSRWIVAVQDEDIIQGSFNAKTGEFTFKADGSGDFTLKPAIILDMSIGNRAFSRNGNPNNMDVAPVIKNNRTLVPVRFIAEALGAKVDWDSDTQTVSVDLDGKTLTLVIGQTGAGLDVPAEIIDDRTMAPLRYISESFGARVDYNDADRSVTIARVIVNSQW
jgi:hypothetical protein